MLNLPAISRAELLLRNQIARKGEQPLRLALTDGDWQVTLRAAPSVGAPAFHLSLEVEGQAAWLGVSASLLHALTRSYLADGSLLELPEPLRGMVIEAALENLLEQWQQRLGIRLVLGAVSAQPAPGGASIGLACRIIGNDVCTDGQVWISNPLLPYVTQWLDALPDAAADGWDELPVPIRFELGWTRLDLAQLRGLEHDDLILIEHGSWLRDQTVSIRIGPSPGFRATLEQQRIILQQREATMENPADTQEALTQLDELPVTVTFDLGETTLALREVKGLQPGYAFALAQGLDKPVTLRANGRAIGAGQLIQVGEQLGVRVVELFVRGHD